MWSRGGLRGRRALSGRPRIAVLVALLAICVTLTPGAQPRIAPHMGHPWWPVLPDAVTEPAADVAVSVAGGSYSSFTFDAGYLDSRTLFIRDYEVWVTNLSATIPGGLLAEAAPAGSLIEAMVAFRGSWPGFLDGIIDLHHGVTGLPDAGRTERDRYELFTMIVDDTPIDDTAIDSYRDEALLLQTAPAVMPSFALRAQTPFAQSSRLARHAGPVLTATSSVGWLPPVSDGRAQPAYVAGGAAAALSGFSLTPWLSLDLQAGVWHAAYPAGLAGWEPVLARWVNWRSRVALRARFGGVGVVAHITAQRTPFRYDHSRIRGVATSIDMQAVVPIGRHDELLMAFVQDFVTFITPDFGVSVGWRRSVGAAGEVPRRVTALRPSPGSR